jgi:hypothetical protein
MCQGRSFDFNCSKNNDETYTLTCNRIIDGDFAYPNSVYQIKANDTFVLLGIELPDVYIQSAEQRLLIAGLKYLAKFDHTKNTYTPELDNIFLNANKDIRKDILVGSLFQFTDNEINGVDANNNGILITLPISQLTIKIGYSMIREYSITLADSLDLSADAVQRTINAVQGYFTNNSGGVASNQVGNLAFAALKDRFLSRLKDDIAKGVITFAKGLIAKLKSTFEQGAQFGSIYVEGLNGEGANIDGEGNAEFQTVNVRGSLTASELDFNRIKIIEGQEMSSRAAGTILSVRKTQDGDKIIKLKLAGDEFGAFKVGDMFRGMYNTLGIAGTTQYKPVDADGNSGDKLVDGAKDKNGFPMRKGFYTAYAMVTSILTDNVWDEAEQCRVFEFTYQNMDGWKDADGIEIEPCAMMKIAQYSNAEDETRQGFMLRNTIGKVYNILYYHCTTWQIHSWNVLKAEGQIKGMEFFVGGDTTQTVTLDNDGTYEAGSHYFNGELKTIDPTTWDDILSKLQNYDIRLSKTADTITVDAVGNVIGGYWTSVTGDDGTVRKAYRLNTAVTAYKADGTALLLNGAFTDDTALVTKGQYAVYATGSDCTPLVVDGVVYITAINNIHDGDAKTTDNIDFAVMRAMKECVVTITVDCEGIGVRSRDYRVVINHDDAAFVTADLSNEMISVAWNTKTSKFIGLPATTEVRMWHGNEKLTVDSVNVVTDLQSVVDITNNAGVLTISDTQDGSTALKDTNLIELTATATYAGISYEQTLYLKITKSADGNTYELMPTSTVINAVNKDGSYVFDNSGKVACGVKCTSTTDGVYDMTAAMLTQRGLTMWYSLQTDNNGDAVDDRTYTAYTLGALIDVTSADEISFEIKKGSTIIDKETVPIVKGGKDGTNGTDGVAFNCAPSAFIIETYNNGVPKAAGSQNFTFTATKKSTDLTPGRVHATESEGTDTSWDTGTAGVLKVSWDNENALVSHVITASVTFKDSDNNSYSHDFIIPITLSKQGDAGAAAVSYELQTNVDAFTFSLGDNAINWGNTVTDNPTITPSKVVASENSITCVAKKRIGQQAATTYTAGALYFVTSANTAKDAETLYSSINSGAGLINLNTNYYQCSFIEFRLYDSTSKTTLLATKAVNINYDTTAYFAKLKEAIVGSIADGKGGIASFFNMNKDGLHFGANTIVNTAITSIFTMMESAIADKALELIAKNTSYNVINDKADMSDWTNTGATISSSNGYNGYGAYLPTNSDTTYKDYLVKNLYLKADSLYILEFYAKGTDANSQLDSYVYPNVNARIVSVNVDAVIYVQDASDTFCRWSLTTDWKKYVVVFKTLPTMTETEQKSILFRLLAGKTACYVSNVKLSLSSYLVGALSGTTEISGGLILSNLMGVRDATGKVQAYMNGLLSKAYAMALGITNFGTENEDSMTHFAFDGSAKIGNLQVKSDGTTYLIDKNKIQRVLLSPDELDSLANLTANVGQTANYSASANSITASTYGGYANSVNLCSAFTVQYAGSTISYSAFSLLANIKKGYNLHVVVELTNGTYTTQIAQLDAIDSKAMNVQSGTIYGIPAGSYYFRLRAEMDTDTNIDFYVSSSAFSGVVSKTNVGQTANYSASANSITASTYGGYANSVNLCSAFTVQYAGSTISYSAFSLLANIKKGYNLHVVVELTNGTYTTQIAQLDAIDSKAMNVQSGTIYGIPAGSYYFRLRAEMDTDTNIDFYVSSSAFSGVVSKTNNDQIQGIFARDGFASVYGPKQYTYVKQGLLYAGGWPQISGILLSGTVTRYGGKSSAYTFSGPLTNYTTTSVSLITSSGPHRYRVTFGTALKSNDYNIIATSVYDSTTDGRSAVIFARWPSYFEVYINDGGDGTATDTGFSFILVGDLMTLTKD